MRPAQPAFVFIDDRPDEDGFADELTKALGMKAVEVVTYPLDFRGDDLERTKTLIQTCLVILMDLNLSSDDYSNWGLDPSWGLALEENLKGWLNKESDVIELPPVAFVLTSNDFKLLPESVTGGLPIAGREHVISRKTGNEWVLEKVEKNRSDAQKDLNFLSELADAVREVAAISKDSDDAKKMAFMLLGIEDVDAEDWRGLAADEAEKNGFPVQAILDGQGSALIKWLTHIALPFPGVFYELRDIALALRLNPSDVRANDQVRTAIANCVSDFQYRGMLSKFLGQRWWRAGVHEFKDEIWDRCHRENEDIRAALEMKLETSLASVRPIEHTDPVLLVNESYLRTDEVCDASEGVRISPDDWPDEIFPPWVGIDNVRRSPRLQKLVLPEDKYRLDD